jgi:glycosidase
VPFLYYGEEIGQIGAKPDEMIRNPMPWTPGDNGGFTATARPWEPLQRGHEQRNVATQDADPQSVLNHYRRWIRLRQSEPALLHGDFRTIDTGRNEVIAWQRSTGNRKLTFIANLSDKPVENFSADGLTQATLGTELLERAALADPDTGLHLGPYAVRLFASGE